MKDLESIIKAIRNKEIRYGFDQDYCFVLDHDGEIVFLKNNPDNPHRRDLERHGEIYNGFPANSYDGEVIWQEYVGESALKTIAEFLDILGIEYLD